MERKCRQRRQSILLRDSSDCRYAGAGEIDISVVDRIQSGMITLRRTLEFIKWMGDLKDGRAKRAIAARIERLVNGNPGDVKPVGHGVSELRIRFGPGYRVYYVQRGSVLIILLCGGDKSTQDSDIKRAYEIAQELEE